MNIDKLYSLFLKYPKIFIDSRKVNGTGIFFALKGDNYNGNIYAKEALNKGAKIAITDDESIAKKDERLIYVKNSLAYLQLLAIKHREQLNIPIIGITGSNGKTTTKEFIALLLSDKYKVGYTQGNLNNHIGVPLTILKIKKEDTIAVIEFGASKKGDIRELCEIAKPTHGLITNIGKAHLKDFKNIETILETKTELWDFLIKNKGIIFINKDDILLNNKASKLLLDNHEKKYFFYGKNLNKENNVDLIPGSHLLKIKYNKSTINTNISGTYNLINIICAIKVATFFDIKRNNIIKLLPKIGVKNRSEFIKTTKNKIILDAYNANPNSMKIAIENFIEIDNYNIKNKIIIIGDMLELGLYELKEHESIIKMLEKSPLPIENIFLVGSIFSNIKSEFLKFETREIFSNYIKENKFNNKMILIKGSRKLELEKLLRIL